MFPLSCSSVLFLLSLSLSVVQYSVSSSFDARKEIEAHATCNGDVVAGPPELAAGIVQAASGCSNIQDKYCAELCVAYNGGFTKGNRYDTNAIKKAGRTVTIGKMSEEAKENILEAVDRCAANLPPLERPTEETESCPEAKQFMECLEEQYEVDCKGKKRKMDWN